MNWIVLAVVVIAIVAGLYLQYDPQRESGGKNKGLGGNRYYQPFTRAQEQAWRDSGIVHIKGLETFQKVVSSDRHVLVGFTRRDHRMDHLLRNAMQATEEWLNEPEQERHRDLWTLAALDCDAYPEACDVLLIDPEVTKPPVHVFHQGKFKYTYSHQNTKTGFVEFITTGPQMDHREEKRREFKNNPSVWQLAGARDNQKDIIDVVRGGLGHLLRQYENVVVFFYSPTCPHSQAQSTFFATMAMWNQLRYVGYSDDEQPMHTRTAFAGMNCLVYGSECTRLNTTALGVPAVWLFKQGKAVEQYRSRLPAAIDADVNAEQNSAFAKGIEAFLKWLKEHDISIPSPQSNDGASGGTDVREFLDPLGIGLPTLLGKTRKKLKIP